MNSGTTSLTDYVSRMKDKQDSIYYIAGSSKDEVEKSPFVEPRLKKGYEFLDLTEAVDEYCIGALPEFETKKFQNVAKEGLSLADGKSKEKLEETKKVFEPLTTWLGENALKDQVTFIKNKLNGAFNLLINIIPVLGLGLGFGS